MLGGKGTERVPLDICTQVYIPWPGVHLRFLWQVEHEFSVSVYTTKRVDFGLDVDCCCY